MELARTVPPEALGIRSLRVVSGRRKMCPVCQVRPVDCRRDDDSPNLCATCYVLREQLDGRMEVAR